jgi:hypothetical protein
VCLKNRSRVEHDGRVLSLFPNCVRALAEAASVIPGAGPIELVVADFQSDDWPLAAWLPAAGGAGGTLRVRVVPVDGPFSRGRGLNLAVARAASDRLLLCDADILIKPEALRRAIEVLDRGGVWFPVCRYLDEKGRLEFWQVYGFGIAALRRTTFDAVGGVPEFYSWGGEDDIFYRRLAWHVPIVRERTEGLDHQWHPRGVRFAHYTRPIKSDYRRHHVGEDGPGAGGWGAPIRVFFCAHPDWTGELYLFENGRAWRPGLDACEFALEERRWLVLRWDRWPALALDWDERIRAYCDRALRLIARETPPEIQNGAPGA